MNTPARTIALSALASGAVYLAVIGTALHFGDLSPFTMSPSAQSQDAPLPDIPSGEREQTIIETVRTAEPAVVSVIVSKNLPVVERYYEEDLFGIGIPRTRQNGTRLREIGGGTAFFVSSDGLLMTNRHVVDDESATYSVLLNDGRTLDAAIVAVDPVSDIALLKVNGKDFPFVKLSAQEEPVLGQTVIAIGNALGEFRNTVSVGVISGLQRSITAGNPARGDAEQLDRIIQTDAAINEGNSGGPLFASDGTVIGMSTAVAAEAENIGFAIPVQDLQRALGSYQKNGRIVRPYIGIRYAPVTPQIAEELKLDKAQGAVIIRGDASGEAAIASGSPASKAGLQENDVILEIDGHAVTERLSVADAIRTKQPGDTIEVKIQRGGRTQTMRVMLEEWKS
jgi:serine protease Do